jgi:hypothetical protein
VERTTRRRGADRTVFISGSHRDAERLRRALNEQGVATTGADELGVAEVWSSALRSALERSDVVIALLDPPKSAPQTFFELGFAEGLGKPVLLVVSPETRLPVDLTGHLVIRPGDDLVSAITFALRQLDAATTWPRTSMDVGSETWVRQDKPIGALADHLLTQVSDWRSLADTGGPASAAGLNLEALVRDALAASAEVVVESPDPEGRVDIGVWADSLSESVGNPLLVEVKAVLRNRGDVQRVSRQLADYLRQSTARTALLVYGDAPSAAAHDALRVLPANILAISVDDLLRRLREQPVGELVEHLHEASSVE